MYPWKQIIEEAESSLVELEKALFTHPELGFKETETKKILLEFLKQAGLHISEDYGVNGFRITIGEGKPHIGLIAELDALVTPGHYACGKDGAAHSCGHHLQGTIMAHVLTLLSSIIGQYQGTVSLFMIAAEEYVDLDFRKHLRDTGEIRLLSGKLNLILEEAFEDVDVLLSCHTMGETSVPSMEVNAMLSGFIYKKMTFKGLASHAAVAPHKGINALNAQVLTQNAIAFLRETFEEKDMIRVHLMSTLGGQTVNSIPSETVLEGYVRSIDSKKLLEVNQKINSAAQHASAAIGAKVYIEDNLGYMPFEQCRQLSDIFVPYMKEVIGENLVDNQKSFAAGDIGDISLFKPVIQIGFSGCKGLVHGADFHMDNPLEALIHPTYVLISGVEDLLANPDKVDKITQQFKPKMDFDAYRKLHHI